MKKIKVEDRTQSSEQLWPDVWFSSEAHLHSPPAASSLRLVLDFLLEILLVIELTWFKVVLSGRDPGRRSAASLPPYLPFLSFLFFLLQPPLMIATSPAICLLFKTVQRKQDVQKERVTHWTYKALLDQVATILCSPNKRNQIPAWAHCVQTAVKVAEPP